MFYNATGTLERKKKDIEHFTITDIGYRDTKFNYSATETT